MTMHGDAANARACAKELIRRWIAMWGVPDVITSDRGAQFVSELWIEMCKLMGIARNTTTSYHPQHNGKIERMHRCLKNSLRARLLGRPNWLAELPWVMLGLRAAANLETQVLYDRWRDINSIHRQVAQHPRNSVVTDRWRDISPSASDSLADRWRDINVIKFGSINYRPLK